MKTRRWALFIVLNMIISVLTTLGVLSLKGELERVVVVTATSAVTDLSVAPTAIPAGEVVPTAILTGEVVPLDVSPTALTSNQYTVQTGDTLGGIAFALDVPLDELLAANGLNEDSIIRPGQLLRVPRDAVPAPDEPIPSVVTLSPTPGTPTPFPTGTPTPPGPVQVRVQEVLAPGELEREGVMLINRGRTVNLQGWTLGAVGDEGRYVFPRLTLAQDVPVTVYTIAGADSPQSLHWGREAAAWGTPDTIIELRDAEGDLIATYTVP